MSDSAVVCKGDVRAAREGRMFAMLGGALHDVQGSDALAAEQAADEQAAAGLDVVTDGRETVPADRAGAGRLADDLLAGRGTGAIERRRAIMAARALAGGAGAGAAVAAALAGPWSLARRASGGAADAGGSASASDAALVRALGAAIGREAAVLAGEGCPLVRVDEPDAARVPGAASGSDAHVDGFLGAHRALVDAAAALGTPDAPAAPLHLMLALTGGDHEALGAEPLADLGYRSYLFDLIHGPDDWRLVARLPGDRGIVCGVVDAGSDLGDAPEVLVWAAHYAASTGRRGPARVGLATTGSLTALAHEAAGAKMRALAEGARIAALPADEVAASLDPRAIDSRTAATGAWYRDPRFTRRPIRDAAADPDR